jgi:hypothetical protein
MRYIRGVLLRLGADVTLGRAEVLLKSPDEADAAERLEVADRLRRL